ncbi:hypothetical protein EKO27_g3592 [Xylaria grammica]|uniref:Uncharacterized protein n=1 Tax=Xylaria grammica TaxID=363999 RepID=A0A439DAT8_9PEZI|nr:hypothetical protein EKO27_g3592 [Xylaria grammica]
MENFARDISETLPTVEGAKRSPRGTPKRLTHVSLPKLIIKPYKGREPIQIPTGQAELFIQVIAAEQHTPVHMLLPLPVFPESPTRSSYRRSKGEHPDPYLVDPPTPATIQFTKIEEAELMQWQETVGGMREAHAKALDQLEDNPRDTQLRQEVRRLRLEREKQATAIAQIHDHRRIRKAFRKDFNGVLLGW